MLDQRGLKRCSRCEKDLPLASFHKRETGQPSSYCKACQREYCQLHYKENKNKHNKARLVRKHGSRAELRRILNTLKAVPCLDCAKSFPTWAMEFDHRNPRTKCFNVSDGVRDDVSKEKLLAEVAKCDVVCVLCHRYRTFARRGVAQLG